MKTIPYGHQQIDKSDIASVVRVLKSDWITQGPAVEQFEQAIARYCKVKYAVAPRPALDLETRLSPLQ